MLQTLQCRLKGGHLFVDSRSRPGMKTCVRCRLRMPFEGAVQPAEAAAAQKRA